MPGFLELQLSFLNPLDQLLGCLLLPTLVEVLDDDAHEHVEDEETNDKQERDEVENQPFVVISLGLKVKYKYILGLQLNSNKHINMHEVMCHKTNFCGGCQTTFVTNKDC